MPDEIPFTWTATLHKEFKGAAFSVNNPTLVEQVEARIKVWIDKGEKGGVLIFERFAVEWRVGDKGP